MIDQPADDEVPDRVRMRGLETQQPDGLDPSTRWVDLTPYYGHLDCFRGICPLVVMTNRFTYAPSYTPRARMQNTWLSIALEAIETLARHCAYQRLPPWQEVAVVGTGNGLDAVGISRIVHARQIVASDIHPRALDAARWNIARFADRDTMATVLRSNLFSDYPAGRTFDLIYENLPNIPDSVDVFADARSASCYAPESDHTASPFDRYLLTLHHDFLVQASPRLRESGWVVCMIGGRIPVEVIDQMFRAAGYRSMIIGSGLKIQSEADLVLPAYAAAERRDGSTFAYYHPLEECAAISLGLPQPAEAPAREAYARKLTERLRACRITATEAARLHALGEPVCHTVYAVAGRLISMERADG